MISDLSFIKKFKPYNVRFRTISEAHTFVRQHVLKDNRASFSDSLRYIWTQTNNSVLNGYHTIDSHHYLVTSNSWEPEKKLVLGTTNIIVKKKVDILDG